VARRGAHPYLTAIVIVLWLAVLAWVLPKIYRIARRGLTTAYRRVGRLARIGRPTSPISRSW
jgi:hypothetical protein